MLGEDCCVQIHTKRETNLERDQLGRGEPGINQRRCCLTSLHWLFKVDTPSIVSVNSMTSACCKLYFCQDFALKMLPALVFFEGFTYQWLNKEYLTAVFQLYCFQVII